MLFQGPHFEKHLSTCHSLPSFKPLRLPTAAKVEVQTLWLGVHALTDWSLLS